MTCLPFPDTKPNASVDLFCFNYAGGSTAVFRDWDAAFPSWLSVRPVEYPGRATRMGQPLVRDPQAMADLLIQELRPHVLRPYALFGHSMGAAMAYRVAVTLQKTQPPIAFFPSGRHSPTCQDPAKPRGHLDDAGLIEAVRELNGSPPEVLANKELMQLIMPVLRADFQLSEAVRVEYEATPLDCHIHVFGGDADPEVPVTELAAWQKVTALPCTQTILTGDHFFLQQDGPFDIMRHVICDALVDSFRTNAITAGEV